VNGDDRAVDPTSSLRKLPVSVSVLSVAALRFVVVRCWWFGRGENRPLYKYFP
jgi:hypothetical protein